MNEDRDPLQVVPGDWIHIAHEGKDVLGMICGYQEGQYRFAYWEQCVLRFGAAGSDRLGVKDEGLTALFRGQIAIDPRYVERCLDAWQPSPAPVAEPLPAPAAAQPESPGVAESEERWVQRLLFADWNPADFPAERFRHPSRLRRGL